MMTIVMGLLVITVLLGALRLFMGPTDADRIIAADILFFCSVAFCALAARMSGRELFLDVAIGLTLIGFVATLAWARLVDIGARERHDERKSS